MAINDEIAAGGRPVQFENPLNNMVKMFNIRNDMQTNQMNQMKMEEANRVHSADMAFKNALRGIRDPNSPEGQLETDRAYFNAGFGDKRAAMRASEEASRKAYNEEQKQLEEEGYAAHREISSDPSDERIAERNRQIQNDIRYSADKKALAADNAGRLINMPYEQRKIEMAQSGANVTERKPHLGVTHTGGANVFTSTDPFSGKVTETGRIADELSPDQRSKMPSGQEKLQKEYTEAEAGIKALFAKANSAKTEPERAQALADAKALSASNSLRGEEITRLQQSTQPVDAKEKLIRDYAQAIREGRSPTDQDMIDLRLQIEHNRSFAPPTRINVTSFDPASNAAQKEFMLESAKQRTALRNSKGAIDNINKAITLIPSSAQFMGPGGEPLLNATSFLNNRLGLSINTKGVTDATELRSRMFNNIIDTLKKLDSTPTQKQQDTLQEALGTLGTDPNALPNVLRAFQDVIRSKVEAYNADVTDAEKRGVKFPYKPQIDLGEYGGRTPPTSAAVAYLKANPATRALYDDKYGPGASDKILQGK
jgi:hypothetical protein